MILKCKCTHAVTDRPTSASGMSPEVEDLYVGMLSIRRRSANAGEWQMQYKDCGCCEAQLVTNVWPDRGERVESFHLLVNHRYLKYLANGMRKVQY